MNPMRVVNLGLSDLLSFVATVGSGRKVAIPCLVVALLCAAAGQAADRFEWADRISALGGIAPGETPRLFGAGTVSLPDRFEYGTTFSPDGRLFFFGVDVGGRAEIHVMRWSDGGWTEGETFLTDAAASYNDPMMSSDGSRLYFMTDRDGGRGNFDIAHVERTAEGWSEVLVVPGISTPANEYFYSESDAGEQFFARNIAAPGARPDFDIFVRDGTTADEGTALSSGINSSHYDGDPLVSADGSMLLFASNRPGGAGKGDLYVSYRTADGSWGAAIRLDSRINTAGHELTPYMTPDGAHVLFSRDGELYWLSASVLEDMREQVLHAWGKLSE